MASLTGNNQNRGRSDSKFIDVKLASISTRLDILLSLKEDFAALKNLLYGSTFKCNDQSGYYESHPSFEYFEENKESKGGLADLATDLVIEDKPEDSLGGDEDNYDHVLGVQLKIEDLEKSISEDADRSEHVLGDQLEIMALEKAQNHMKIQGQLKCCELNFEVGDVIFPRIQHCRFLNIQPYQLDSPSLVRWGHLLKVDLQPNLMISKCSFLVAQKLVWELLIPWCKRPAKEVTCKLLILQVQVVKAGHQNSAAFHHLTIEILEDKSLFLRLEDKSIIGAGCIDRNPNSSRVGNKSGSQGINGSKQLWKGKGSE